MELAFDELYSIIIQYRKSFFTLLFYDRFTTGPKQKQNLHVSIIQISGGFQDSPITKQSNHKMESLI